MATFHAEGFMEVERNGVTMYLGFYDALQCMLPSWPVIFDKPVVENISHRFAAVD